jgi:site-specific DNA-methyltransferase (adenine-specific)
MKNKNELPVRLLTKIIQYSSNEGDLICDFFLGSFSTAKVAIGLNRRACGFEKSETAFTYQMNAMKKITPGYLQADLRQPPANRYFNQGKALDQHEKEEVIKRFAALKKSGWSKKQIFEELGKDLGRGPWSLENILAETLHDHKSSTGKTVPGEQ